MLTGDQLLGEQIGSSFRPSRFLRERLRRGKAVPGPRQSLTGAVSRGTGRECLEMEQQTLRLYRKKRLEAGFLGFILIRVKSETLAEE